MGAEGLRVEPGDEEFEGGEGFGGEGDGLREAFGEGAGEGSGEEGGVVCQEFAVHEEAHAVRADEEGCGSGEGLELGAGGEKGWLVGGRWGVGSGFLAWGSYRRQKVREPVCV